MGEVMLPKRRPVAIGAYNSTYKLKDFMFKSDDFIKGTMSGTVLVDKDDVFNITLLEKVISLRGITQVNCLDYESALFLENNLDCNVDIALVDDYNNQDRSYIDTTKFTNHNFSIPLSYFMWGVNFDDSCNVKGVRYCDFDTMTSLNGDAKLSKDTLKKIKEIVKSISRSNLSHLDKCILVSNYLQARVQFVEGLKSYADKVYLVNGKDEELTPKKVGSLTSVINENYGLCMAIANATTLLLNNPMFNVNARTLFGSSHAWNVVLVEGNYYYIDNTWAITRNKNRVSEALKATSFSDDYLLFGLSSAKEMGHHNSICYSRGKVALYDYDREIIRSRVRRLSLDCNFDCYPTTLRFNSKVVD